MLAISLNIPCSKRCERVLALAYLLSPDSLIAIAHRLVNNRERSAIVLAKRLISLPADRARELALKTLAESGITTESDEREMEEMSQIVGTHSKLSAD